MSISALSLQEFRYLVAIADTGSFTGAAAECFVTQPTLSTQLKKLENSLGVRLVERTNKSARLTPVGERVVERARMVLAECEAIAELARSAGDPFGEPLRLGIIATLGPYLLPRLLPVLKKSLPRLDLIIREGLTKDLLERLQDHRLDCVLLALPVTEKGLAVKRLFAEPFWLVCPSGHPLTGRRAVGEIDLIGESILLLSEGHCFRDQALELCGQTTQREADSYRATSLETLRHLVGAGFGCTLVPALALGDELRPGSAARAIPFDSRKARRDIGLVWRRSFTRREAIDRLAELIEAKSGKWLAKFQPPA